MLLINNETVEEILDMKGCIDALETGYRDLLAERAVYRPRIDLYVPQDDPERMYRWGTMEGASRSFGVFAIRMKSDMLEWPEGGTVEKYCMEPGTYCGLVLVFSARNAEPLAIINDGIIQHMRVGACAGLAARYLARDDAAVVGMLGSGGMAETYLRAFAEVRKLREVKVYSPTQANREAYARRMSEMLGVPVTAREGVEEVVRGSDMVATCTDSVRVVVENSGWVEDGAFVTCVRSNEWEPGILDRCDVIVKLGRGTIGTLDQGMRRIAGYASYVAGTEDETERIVTPSVDLFAGQHPLLTDLMGGTARGRKKDSDVTLFLNDGTQGLQFASVAGYVVQKAREVGAGREIPREWFTQNIRD